jgi:hypothetical protein
MNNKETTQSITERNTEDLRTQVKSEANRIAEIGQWPDWMKGNAQESLSARIPEGGKTAPGFDAGVACTLDLIPRERQLLAAALHGAYTPEKVEQILRESADMDPDSETAWWLSACSVCEENKPIDEAMFKKQLADFEGLAADPKVRREAAQNELKRMTGLFETGTYGVPFGKEDGCMQGAYVAGYPFAAQYSERYGIYFIGTFHDDLGLQDFAWSEKKDEEGRAKSGPVFGSKQFVKCADKDEFLRALEVVKEKFKDKMPGHDKVKDKIEALLPEEFSGYYQALNTQHFGRKTYGSRFYENPDTGAADLQSLLRKAYEQRGTLDGDDREWFKSQGVGEEALLPSCRYLKVGVEGKLGIKKAGEFPPGTPVRVVVIKPGEPGSFTVEVESDHDFPEVDYGTIIIGAHSRDAGKPDAPQMLKTVHPGAPAAMFQKTEWTDGTVISIKDLIDRFGPDQHVVLRSKVSATADQLEAYSNKLQIPSLLDRINRGLDPIGILAIPELNGKVEALCKKMKADYDEVVEMTKMIQLAGPWSHIEKLKVAEDPVTRVWIMLNAVNTIGKEREKDLTEDEFLADLKRINLGLEQALADPEAFFPKARSHVLEESKKRFRVEDGIPISEMDNGFIAMGIQGCKAGVYQDPDGLPFVGSANEIRDDVIAGWGLKPVVETDRRTVQGKVVERQVTYYQNKAGDSVAKKIYPGFVIVLSRNMELAKAIAKVALTPDEAQKPSDKALGHMVYHPTSMKEEYNEISPEITAFRESMREQFGPILKNLPVAPEQAPLSERFYPALTRIKLQEIFEDAAVALREERHKKGREVTEEDLKKLWPKLIEKQKQKMEELKYICGIFAPQIPDLPPRATRVVDMCGGAGDLGLAIAMTMLEHVRPLKEALIVDSEDGLDAFFDTIIRNLPQSEDFQRIGRHQTAMVQEAPITENDIVVAKHACGTLTDSIMENWVNSKSPMLIIMTCCQEKASYEPARYDISQEDWTRWCKLSGGTNSTNPKKLAEGIDAMTKLDTARVDYLKRHGFEASLFQNRAFPKGDVIIARRTKY